MKNAIFALFLFLAPTLAAQPRLFMAVGAGLSTFNKDHRAAILSNQAGILVKERDGKHFTGFAAVYIATIGSQAGGLLQKGVQASAELGTELNAGRFLASLSFSQALPVASSTWVRASGDTATHAPEPLTGGFGYTVAVGYKFEGFTLSLALSSSLADLAPGCKSDALRLMICRRL
jgi:hypothetical protein